MRRKKGRRHMGTVRAKISINGLMAWDDTLFSDMVLPTALVADKQLIVDEICLECSDMSLIYADWNFMKAAIKHWSSVNKKNWEKLYNTTVFDYNPIWNKDGKISEKFTDTRTGNRETTSKMNTETSNVETSSGETEQKVAGYNGSDYANREKDLSQNSNVGQAEAGSTGSAEEQNSEIVIHEYEKTEQGNIGVTTTQQMIKEEREIDLFNIYREIANSFKKEFCIMLY